MQWRPIENAPTDDRFLAAVRVINNQTGREWWEMHVVFIDSETGEIDCDSDAGWAIADYSHWMPLPDAPH